MTNSYDVITDDWTGTCFIPEFFIENEGASCVYICVSPGSHADKLEEVLKSPLEDLPKFLGESDWVDNLVGKMLMNGMCHPYPFMIKFILEEGRPPFKEF